MSIKNHHIAIVLEVLLQELHYGFTNEQEEIQYDPYKAIEKSLLLYIANDPSMKDKIFSLLSEIKPLSGKSIDKILENNYDKKVILKFIKELKTHIISLTT